MNDALRTQTLIVKNGERNRAEDFVAPDGQILQLRFRITRLHKTRWNQGMSSATFEIPEHGWRVSLGRKLRSDGQVDETYTFKTVAEVTEDKERAEFENVAYQYEFGVKMMLRNADQAVETLRYFANEIERARARFQLRADRAQSSRSSFAAEIAQAVQSAVNNIRLSSIISDEVEFAGALKLFVEQNTSSINPEEGK